MNITDGTTFYLVLGVEADPPTDIMDFDTSMALVFNSREEAVDHVHGLIGEDKTLNDYFIFQCRAVMQAKLQVQLEEIESATKP